MRVILCLMASHPEREEFVSDNVYRALDHVDAVAFVNGGRHHFEIQDWEKVHTVHRLWDDKFCENRNAYLRKVDDLVAQWQDDTLICVADDDELYSSELWRDIRAIGEWALENDRNQIGIRRHSVTLTRNGQKVREHVDDYFKGLIVL